MSKVNLNNLVNLQNEASAVNIINTNNDAIEVFSDDVVSRSGKQPNQMNSELDMNSNRILNLPEPITDTEPVRLQDIAVITEPSTGNVTSIATPSGGAATVFSGTGGKIITDYKGTGLVKSTSGVLSPAVADTDYVSPTAVIDIAHGGTGQTTANDAFSALKYSATETYTGTVELATTTEANAGTDTTRAVTPAGIDAYYNGHINSSLSPYSTITRPFRYKTSAYTFATSDSGAVVCYQGTPNVSFTMSVATNTALPTGSQIDLINLGSGKLSIAAEAGISLLSTSSFLTLSDLYSAATLFKVGSTYWVLFGNLKA